MSLVKTVKKNKKAPAKKNTAVIVPEDNKNLESSLLKAIDKSMEGSNGKIWKQSQNFAPSSTNQCARYHYYRFNGFHQDIQFAGQTRRIFEMGNRVEDYMSDIFENLGILVDSQIPISSPPPVPIKGYIDFIIEWDGKKIVECKSINDAGFTWRKTYHKAKDEHFRQIQFYFYCYPEIDEGFIVYFNKNDSSILPILVKRDDEFLGKITKKYEKIYNAIQNGIVPARPYKQSSEKCQRCDAREQCWADSEVGVKL